jgi:hypothetical protein
VRGAGFVIGALALAACSPGASEPPLEVAEGAERIDCALGPGLGFVADCTIERSQAGGIHTMIVRHPDGGFRRFEVGADNRIAVTDGADAAEVSVTGATAEVTVGDDRYRIPLKPAAAAFGTDASQP